MKNIKNALKNYKKDGRTQIKLNASSDDLMKEVRKLVLEDLIPLTVEMARKTEMVICLAHPEWKCKAIEREYKDKWFHIGRGCNSAVLFDNEVHFWASVDNLPYGLNWSEVFSGNYR